MPLRRFVPPIADLRRDTCVSLLAPSQRWFNEREIGEDRLLSEVWLNRQDQNRPVCENEPYIPDALRDLIERNPEIF
jgi:hypothetical protein